MNKISCAIAGTIWEQGEAGLSICFNIYSYQPAQKWFKDRKSRVLGFNDARHYQKIIKALVETDRIMKEIDGVAGVITNRTI